mmetsp:Transcript_37794/g.48193  ORF Transcript_37794/g.48193 Transcript_37794/m.48193 type:complete len:161 (+) Transcript_37794:164-646(+)
MNAPPKNAVPLLLYVEDESLDFSGDSGAIGRLNVHDSSIMIDLKGKQFNAQIFPSAGSMMILGAGPNDIKVDTVMNECCKLHYIGSMFDAMDADILKGEMAAFGGSDDEGNNFGGGIDSDDDTGKGKKETGKSAKGGGKKRKKTTGKKTTGKKKTAKKSA